MEIPSTGSQRKLLAALLVIALIQSAAGLKRSDEPVERQLSLISPTPRDYVKLYQLACGQSKRLTTSELLQLYPSNQSVLGRDRVRQSIATYRIERECRREPSAWRYRYIDEDGDIAVRDSSIDERLANVNYLTRSIKAAAIDIFTYDWGDKEVDARNRELVAGPQVNNELCGRQLERMVGMIDELATKNEQLRAGQRVLLSDRLLSLAKLLDSFGRYTSGFLYGRTLSIGSYDQCRTNRLIVSETQRIKMRFCWAHLSLDHNLDESLRVRPRDEMETQTNVLSAGICIPESCHSKSFHDNRQPLQALVSSQFKLPRAMYINESLPLDSIYCLADTDSRFRVPLFGKLLLLWLASWLLLALIVTIRNARRNDTRERARRSVLDSFDLMDSFKDFLSARERASDFQSVELNTINVVKTGACLFVVVAHALALFIGYSMDELYSAKFLERDPILLTIVAASMTVDTFFAISGILWAFFTLKRLHKYDNRNSGKQPTASCNDQPQTELRPELAQLSDKSTDNNHHGNNTQKFNHYVEFEEANKRTIKPSDGARFFFINWIMLTLFRYLRIVPLFVLVHWFKKFVYIFAGSGPLWDHGFNLKSFNGACRQESMWIPFTFMSAYLPLTHQCTLQSWSISNDLFFAILAPPAIMFMYKKPRLAIWITYIAGLISMAAATFAVSSTPEHIDEELRELRSWGFYRLFDKVSTLYTAPHYRIFCFLIGAWGGYHLRQQQIKIDEQVSGEQECEVAKIRQSMWPWWVRGPATWISFAYILLVPLVFMNNESLKKHLDPMYRQIYPQFLSGLRFLWSLSNTIIFLRMMTDWKDNLWMRMSSAKFWQIFTKLNYPILLTHMDLLLFTMQVARTPPTNLTIWAFINTGLGVFVTSIPLSILLHIVYENVCDKLIRSLLPNY